jgi:DNA-binding transcriptional ArsR family regulator
MELTNKTTKKTTFDDVFSSKGRTKILKLLAINEELNISEIIKKTSLNHTNVVSHLNALKDFDLVQEKQYGRIRIYRYKLENQKARALKKIIELWDSD